MAHTFMSASGNLQLRLNSESIFIQPEGMLETIENFEGVSLVSAFKRVFGMMWFYYLVSVAMVTSNLQGSMFLGFLSAAVVQEFLKLSPTPQFAMA